MEKFWKKYIEADMLEREQITLKLWNGTIKRSFKAYQDLKVSEEDKDKMMAQWLNSYFDDLANVASYAGEEK